MYGALSNPGVAIGTGSRSSPSARSASPSITTSWHGPSRTSTGSIGRRCARAHRSATSSGSQPKPSA
jgi:hypothetical protein